ncbi:hypothetical protein Bca4012_026611 [Brassica carinata]
MDALGGRPPVMKIDDALASDTTPLRFRRLRRMEAEEWVRDIKVSSRKLASAIVTPSRLDHPMAENVTVRNIGEGRSLTFSPLNGKDPLHADDQIIDALLDMELVDQKEGGMMDVEVNDDDLLALDLMEMEDRRSQTTSFVGHGEKDA